MSKDEVDFIYIVVAGVARQQGFAGPLRLRRGLGHVAAGTAYSVLRVTKYGVGSLIRS